MNKVEKFLLTIHKAAEISKYFLLLGGLLFYFLSSRLERKIYIYPFIIVLLLPFFVKGFTGLLLKQSYNFGPRQMYFEFKKKKFRFDFRLKATKGKRAIFLDLFEIIISLLIFLSIK